MLKFRYIFAIATIFGKNALSLKQQSLRNKHLSVEAEYCSVQTKVRFCPLAGAGPPARQNAEHLAGSGPLVGVQRCRISDRSSGKYRSFGKLAGDLSKMQTYLDKMGRAFCQNGLTFAQKWPNIWQLAEPLALTGCLAKAGYLHFLVAGGLAG